jgi:hypothetical protein
MTSAAVAPDRQAVLRRRIRLLVAATITYNVIEAVVALAAGTIASSVALIGFGLDSVRSAPPLPSPGNSQAPTRSDANG